MKADFAISMVVFNTGKATLEKALTSVKLQSIPFHFILVDHSLEHSYRSFLPAGPSWNYLARENLGYGSGNNAGLKNLPDSDYVLILNPDVILNNDTLKVIKQMFFDDTEGRIGILSGKILNPDLSWQNLNKRIPSLAGLLGRRFAFLQKWNWFRQAVARYEMEDCDPEKEQDVELLPGCFLCLRRSVWEQIHGFDESFFLYFEDYDLCQKCKELGYRVVYSPKFSVIHEYQRKSHSSAWHFYLFAKSMIRFFRKWGFRWQ